MRRFELRGGTSAKFWEIASRGAAVTVRFGRLGVVVLLSTAACGTARPTSGDPPRVVASASASAILSASTAPTGSSSAPPPAEKHIAISTQPNDVEIDAAAPGAKCDFDRAYRGKVGETPVSLVLRRHAKDGARVTGLSHYDREGDGIAIKGKTDGASFTIDESPGGTFAGTCDAATGVLSGSFTLGKATSTFSLKPRPSDWPGIYQVTKNASAESHDPECAAVAKPDEAVPLGPWGACPPTNPQKRKEFYKDAPDLGCTIHDTSLRVFGMKDKNVEAKVNAKLAMTPYDADIKSITACTSTPMNAWYDEFIVRLGGGLLVFDSFRSEYSGGAHPMNFKSGPTTIDLTTGGEIKLEDAVTDLGKLKVAASRCVALYNGSLQGDVTSAPLDVDPPEAKCGADGGGMAVFLWGCTENPRPSLTIVPEGVVIAQSGNPHVSSVMDGWGPVIPWAVLVRDGIVPAESPIARLWKDVKAAAPNDLPCGSAYEGDTWRTWRVE